MSLFLSFTVSLFLFCLFRFFRVYLPTYLPACLPAYLPTGVGLQTQEHAVSHSARILSRPWHRLWGRRSKGLAPKTPDVGVGVLKHLVMLVLLQGS